MFKKIFVLFLLFLLINCCIKINSSYYQNNNEQIIINLKNKALYYVRYNYPFEQQLFALLDYYKYVQNDNIILEHLIRVNYELQNIIDVNYYLEELLKIDPQNNFAKNFKEKKANELIIEKYYLYYETPNFKCYYKDANYYTIIKTLVEELENQFVFIANDFEYFNKTNKIIILFYSIEDYDNLSTKPYWSSAYYDGKIRINTYLFKKGDIRNILKHELIHSIITLKSGYKVPIWLHEGLAQYYEFNKKIYFKFPEEYKLKFLSLQKIENSFNILEPDEIEIAYLESLFLIKYILEIYGERIIIELLNEFKKNNNFDEVYRKILLRDRETLEFEFKNYLKNA
ncbi:MAG TPA: peptidase MA family metallohydrolase [bacterium]|nr:peptidase MA family metallohydrolase [bacterium]HOL48244.1 peptidase MA family metallohydrolase [bacterium]HPQ19375.1 peptidase MA family metallohydrolase [bacterium]